MSALKECGFVIQCPSHIQTLQGAGYLISLLSFLTIPCADIFMHLSTLCNWTVKLSRTPPLTLYLLSLPWKAQLTEGKLLRITVAQSILKYLSSLLCQAFYYLLASKGKSEFLHLHKCFLVVCISFVEDQVHVSNNTQTILIIYTFPFEVIFIFHQTIKNVKIYLLIIGNLSWPALVASQGRKVSSKHPVQQRTV